MTLPVQVPNVPEWQMCRVRWTIRDYSGAPQVVDSVRFFSAVPYVIAAGSKTTLAALFPEVRFVAGRLTNPAGDPWVDVVASMDPDINPSGWTITAAAMLAGGQAISATFMTPVNGDIDLSTQVPVAVSKGTAIIRGRGVDSITNVTGTNSAVVTYSDGTTQVLALPAGTGTGGGSSGVAYSFPTAVATWSITHSLGRMPYGVQVVVGNSEVTADIDMPNTSQVVITHAVPTAGRVILL